MFVKLLLTSNLFLKINKKYEIFTKVLEEMFKIFHLHNHNNFNNNSVMVGLHLQLIHGIRLLFLVKINFFLNSKIISFRTSKLNCLPTKIQKKIERTKNENDCTSLSLSLHSLFCFFFLQKNTQQKKNMLQFFFIIFVYLRDYV